MVIKRKKNGVKADIAGFFNVYKPAENFGKIFVLTGAADSCKSGILGAIAGVVPVKNAVNAKVRAGYLPPELPFFRGSSLKKEIDFICRISGNNDGEFVKDLLGAFNVEKFQEKPFKNLNESILQKAGIIQAFAGRPEIIILDEPMKRLDQAGIEEFKFFLENYKKRYLKNAAIIVASGTLSFLWDIADEMIFITGKGEYVKHSAGTLQKKLSIYLLSENLFEDFRKENPDARYRKTAEGGVRILITADDAKRIHDKFLKKPGILTPEDAFYYYCG